MGVCSSKESPKPQRQLNSKVNATADTKNTKPKATKSKTTSTKPNKNNEGRRLGSQQDKPIQKSNQLVGKEESSIEQKEHTTNEHKTEITTSSAAEPANKTKITPAVTTTPANTDKNIARQLAAKAAQERFDNMKKKNESGILGRKLEQERKKTTKDFGLETGKEKLDDSKNDNLIYD